MANVNLKTDFKDGEFLYADQLKNNFEAIQAALAAMNAIVWQDNADKVVTFRGTTEELMNREIIDGQILYDTTTGESYIDYLGKRISTGSGNAIHIGDTEPTNPSTQLWVDKDELAGVGSEVVNSLEGNQERMAPSVAAVNNMKNKLELVEDLLKRVIFNETPTGNCNFYKSGKLVVITYQGESKVHDTGELLFTLPQDCKPTRNVFAVGYSNLVSPVHIIINTDGEVKINAITTADTGRIYFTVVFVTN
jgi:hypothetical protein